LKMTAKMNELFILCLCVNLINKIEMLFLFLFIASIIN
jgi:hypothetical protein